MHTKNTPIKKNICNKKMCNKKCIKNAYKKVHMKKMYMKKCMSIMHKRNTPTSPGRFTNTVLILFS